jgi:hypothetical protein
VPTQRSETDEKFEVHIAPSRDALNRLIDVSRALADKRGRLPDANSQGMAERAEGMKYGGDPPWDREPAAWTQELANVVIYGGEDQAKGLIRLLEHEITPVYAHIVLARAALEHAAKAFWLLDSRIGVKLRTARGVNERLHTLAETARLPLPDDERERAKERRSEMWEQAHVHGFVKVRPPGGQGPWTLDERTPSQTELVKKLFASGDDRSLGAVLYGYYSGVAHGSIFGLSQSLSRDLPEDTPGSLRETQAAIYTSSSAVVTVITGVILGLGNAYKRRNEFFGWNSSAWNEAYAAALNAVNKGRAAGQR